MPSSLGGRLRPPGVVLCARRGGAVRRVNVRRVALAAVLVLVVLIAGGAVAGWYLGKVEDDRMRQMKPYLPDKQQERAQDLVSALNSRDPRKLQLLRNTSAAPDAPDNLQLDRLIEAAFPLPDCRYALDSVRDRGEQGTMDVSWVSSDTRTYRYDMLITETCPGRAPLHRVIAVIAVPYMGGYWTDASLLIER